MNKQTEEALRMAIEAMEDAQDMINDGGSSLPNYFFKQINACKAALQETALYRMAENARELGLEWEGEQPVACMIDWEKNISTPLYTRPTKRLSDDEIFELCPYIDHDLLEEAFYRGARAIEKAHGIGESDG